MRLLTFLEYMMVFIGAVGMIAAGVYYLPKGVHLGLFLVGAGITLGGLESIHTRRISFRFTTVGNDLYAGTPALIWGSMILLIGLTLIAAAYLMEEGLWRTTVNHVMRRPGGLLMILGLVIACAGALIVFTPRTRGLAWTLFVRVPKTLLGLAIVAVGLAALVLGVWELADPRSFTRVTRDVLAQYRLAPFDHYWRRLLGPLL